MFQIGMIMQWMFSEAPPFWLLFGQTVQADDFPLLANSDIPSAWRVGSTIVLPDVDQLFLIQHSNLGLGESSEIQTSLSPSDSIELFSGSPAPQFPKLGVISVNYIIYAGQ